MMEVANFVNVSIRASTQNLAVHGIYMDLRHLRLECPSPEETYRLSSNDRGQLRK